VIQLVVAGDGTAKKLEQPAPIKLLRQIPN
jgi:hypothetical protein